MDSPCVYVQVIDNLSIPSFDIEDDEIVDKLNEKRNKGSFSGL
jgi:hypothetical protein